MAGKIIIEVSDGLVMSISVNNEVKDVKVMIADTNAESTDTDEVIPIEEIKTLKGDNVPVKCPCEHYWYADNKTNCTTFCKTFDNLGKQFKQ